MAGSASRMAWTAWTRWPVRSPSCGRRAHRISRGDEMDRLRTALIGCGKIGQIHAAALRDLPESDFVAVCDSDRERAAAFAGRYGTRAFTDVGAMLRDAGVQAVTLCTPHPLHAGPVVQAAEAGVHALVEKPLAAT